MRACLSVASPKSRSSVPACEFHQYCQPEDHAHTAIGRHRTLIRSARTVAMVHLALAPRQEPKGQVFSVPSCWLRHADRSRFVLFSRQTGTAYVQEKWAKHWTVRKTGASPQSTWRLSNNAQYLWAYPVCSREQTASRSSIVAVTTEPCHKSYHIVHTAAVQSRSMKPQSNTRAKRMEGGSPPDGR